MAAAPPGLLFPPSSFSSLSPKGTVCYSVLSSEARRIGSPYLPLRSLCISSRSRSFHPVLAGDYPPGGSSGGGGGLGGGDRGENGRSRWNSWLAIFWVMLNFSGFKEGLLGDNLFPAKVAMECGVAIFTKIAAELERQKENFMKGFGFSIADVVMDTLADLVRLPASTVSLQALLQLNAESRFHLGLSMTCVKASQNMKLDDHNDVLRRMLSVLETEAGKSSKQFISVGAAIAVGAAVGIIGLLGYRAYLTRKGKGSLD